MGPKTASADPPELGACLAAWFEVRGWLDAGTIPDPTERAGTPTIPDSDGLAVVLRLDGRTVGTGESTRGGSDALRTATREAVKDAFADRVLRGLSTADRRKALSRLQLELEIAGQRRPLVGATLAAAASRIRPGIDGIAVRRRKEVAAAFPGRMLATGTAEPQSTTLIRLIRELGLPPKDLPELRRIDAVQLETFETTRIGQDAANASPVERRRGGAIVTSTPLDEQVLLEVRSRLDDRLRRWRPSPPTDDALELDTPLEWLGPFSPVSDRHQPLDATDQEALVATWALSDDPTIAIPTPDRMEAMSAELVDLGILASSRRGDRDQAADWIGLREAWPPDPSCVGTARRAAALAFADANLVTDAEIDEAHEAAWSMVEDANDIVAAFDWLALAELGRTSRGMASSVRLESIRAVQDALLLRQRRSDAEDSGGIPLTEGLGATPDARSVRVLLGMAALVAIADDDEERERRIRRGLEELVRFARQLMLDPSEAADLKGGRTGLGGVQNSLSDPEQSLAATATTRLAIDLLRSALVPNAGP